jgi:hypothetical protein
MHPHPSPEAIPAPRFRWQRTHSIYLCFSCATPPPLFPLTRREVLLGQAAQRSTARSRLTSTSTRKRHYCQETGPGTPANAPTAPSATR